MYYGNNYYYPDNKNTTKDYLDVAIFTETLHLAILYNSSGLS
jgi:hypothetical protein